MPVTDSSCLFRLYPVLYRGTGLKGDIVTDEAANLATVIGTVVAVLLFVGGLWRYPRRGHRLSIEIIPPRNNRKNRAVTDRTITVSVSNHGDEPALSKLRLRTLKSRMVVRFDVTNEALFDDSTPWSPSIKLLPGDAKTYDLKFFEGWTQGGNPRERIEVAVFLRGVKKPVVASVSP